MGTPRVHDLSQFGPELGGSHMPGSDGLRWSPATPRMSMSGAPSSKDLISSLRCTDVAFVSFLEGCLQWDAQRRLTPEQALRHDWVLEGTAPPQPQQPATARRADRPMSSARAAARHGGASARGRRSSSMAGETAALAGSSAREVAALGGWQGAGYPQQHALPMLASHGMSSARGVRR